MTPELRHRERVRMEPRITRSTLNALVRRPGPWVTITTPLAGGGPLAKQDPIRYRNLVRSVEDQLSSHPNAGEREAILRALRAVPSHEVFNSGAPGMVVFCNPEGAELWHLPETVPELAVVNERPYLESILPIVSNGHHFYLVVLTLHGTDLYSCDRWSARPLPLPEDTPKRLEDAAGWDLEEQHLQYHDYSRTSGLPGRNVGSQPIFHSQGEGRDDWEVDVEKYVRAVAQALERTLAHPDAPIVLACAPKIGPIFRRVTRLKHVLEPALHGSYRQRSPEELHELAWVHIAPHFAKAVEHDRRRFQQLRRTGRTMDDVEDIVLAAMEGRVETLFARVGAALMGIIDEERRRVHFKAFSRVPIDLVERAASDTYLGGGTVHLVEDDAMPNETDSPLAAILRY